MLFFNCSRRMLGVYLHPARAGVRTSKRSTGAFSPRRIDSHPDTGPRPTSGGRSAAGSRRFMPQPLPPNFCWHRCKRALPGGRSPLAVCKQTAAGQRGAARRRVCALIPGGRGGRRELPGPRRPSNLKTLQWSVFPPRRAGAVLTPVSQRREPLVQRAQDHLCIGIRNHQRR